MISTTVKIDVPKITARRILDLNANPRTRATAGRRINQQTRGIIKIAQSIAAAELKNDRPESRRRNKGIPHYIDSFEVLPNDVDNIGRLVGGFRNFHPNATRIEYRTKPHPIRARTAPDLLFPYRPGATRSKVGGPPGDWPVTFGEAGSLDFKGKRVSHPGTKGLHIIRRARERYRRQARA